MQGLRLQRIPTLREKLRNPGIARQGTDSYFAQRNPKIARLPGLRETHMLMALKVHVLVNGLNYQAHYTSRHDSDKW